MDLQVIYCVVTNLLVIYYEINSKFLEKWNFELCEWKDEFR